MRLLVLGGTRFVGWAVVTAAVEHGWDVTTFNRGRSGADAAGIRALRGDRTRMWSEMPLWRSFPGVWQVDSGAALAAGLSCRLLAVTVADTWSWLQGGSGEVLDNERVSEIGISREREQQVLASVA
jgi:2'-hydroxyisoflavone reductase